MSVERPRHSSPLIPMLSTQINWFITAGTLRSAFELQVREDGSEFWALTAQARQTVDNLTSFIHELHDEELPNDWRYQTIVAILDAIIDVSNHNDSPEWNDEAFEIANSLTSIYTSELSAWFAENGSRASYHDDAQEEGLIHATASLHDRLAMAQYQCIHGMVVRIMCALELL